MLEFERGEEGHMGVRERETKRDVLKNVRVMNLRDIFPRPMSRPVAAPQGAMRLR